MRMYPTAYSACFSLSVHGSAGCALPHAPHKKSSCLCLGRWSLSLQPLPLPLSPSRPSRTCIRVWPPATGSGRPRRSAPVPRRPRRSTSPPAGGAPCHRSLLSDATRTRRPAARHGEAGWPRWARPGRPEHHQPEPRPGKVASGHWCGNARSTGVACGARRWQAARRGGDGETSEKRAGAAVGRVTCVPGTQGTRRLARPRWMFVICIPSRPGHSGSTLSTALPREM